MKLARLVLRDGCGHLVFPDGSESREVLTREEAYAEVRNALSERRIVALEAAYLVGEVKKSDLQTESEMAPLKHRVEEMLGRVKGTLH
jgi:hypothetical protein